MVSAVDQAVDEVKVDIWRAIRILFFLGSAYLVFDIVL